MTSQHATLRRYRPRTFRRAWFWIGGFGSFCTALLALVLVVRGVG